MLASICGGHVDLELDPLAGRDTWALRTVVVR